MKFIVAAIAFITITLVNGQSPLNLTEDQKQAALQHTTACIAQEKSTTDGVGSLISGKFDGLDRSTKCFANCFLEKAGFLINGVVQPPVILTKLGSIVGADKINAIMTQCNDLKGSDNCETAFVLYECYYKQNAAIF